MKYMRSWEPQYNEEKNIVNNFEEKKNIYIYIVNK